MTHSLDLAADDAPLVSLATPRNDDVAQVDPIAKSALSDLKQHSAFFFMFALKGGGVWCGRSSHSIPTLRRNRRMSERLCFCDWTYAVGVLCLSLGRLRTGGRAVLFFSMVYGFSALRAEKPYTEEAQIPYC